MRKKTGSILAIILILLAVIAVSVALLFLHQAAVKNSVVKNSAVINEVHRLQSIVYKQNLTLEDISKLQQMTSNDSAASELVNDIIWLINNDENMHVEHTLAFLDSYVSSGTAIFCIPHEMLHAGLYIKHGDYQKAQESIDYSSKNLDAWYLGQAKQRQRLPAYYKNFDYVSGILNATLKSLQNHDYSNRTLENIQYVSDNSVC